MLRPLRNGHRDVGARRGVRAARRWRGACARAEAADARVVAECDAFPRLVGNGKLPGKSISVRTLPCKAITREVDLGGDCRGRLGTGSGGAGV